VTATAPGEAGTYRPRRQVEVVEHAGSSAGPPHDTPVVVDVRRGGGRQ
jgi:hypothetical protein